MPTPLPDSADYTDSGATEGECKTFITNLRAFIAGLFGTDGTAATARSTLGLGSMATQDADAVAITGGSITGVVINPRGHIAGLTLSNNGTATKLDVAAGTCRDSTNAADITLASAITAGLIQTSGSWAAGSVQNKLDTGARANSTWYHVFVIKKDSDGSGDFLFSLSASAPTMPGGYTYKRRIGSVLTDGSGNITAFTQDGDLFLWTSPAADFTNYVSGSTTSALRTLTVPTGIKVRARFRAAQTNTGAAGGMVLFTSPSESDVAVGSDHASLYNSVINHYAMGSFELLTNTSAQVRSRDSATDNKWHISTTAWIDHRGRFD